MDLRWIFIKKRIMDLLDFWHIKNRYAGNEWTSIHMYVKMIRTLCEWIIEESMIIESISINHIAIERIWMIRWWFDSFDSFFIHSFTTGWDAHFSDPFLLGQFLIKNTNGMKYFNLNQTYDVRRTYPWSYRQYCTGPCKQLVDSSKFLSSTINVF